MVGIWSSLKRCGNLLHDCVMKLKRHKYAVAFPIRNVEISPGNILWAQVRFTVRVTYLFNLFCILIVTQIGDIKFCTSIWNTECGWAHTLATAWSETRASVRKQCTSTWYRTGNLCCISSNALRKLLRACLCNEIFCKFHIRSLRVLRETIHRSFHIINVVRFMDL